MGVSQLLTQDSLTKSSPKMVCGNGSGTAKRAITYKKKKNPDQQRDLSEVLDVNQEEKGEEDEEEEGEVEEEKS